MARSVEVIAAELADREAIRECLAKIARASDRAQLDLWRECFWPEAVDDHAGLFAGKMIELLEKSMPFLDKLDGTTHFMGNLNFNALESDVAETETNAIAFLVLPGASAMAKEQVAMRSLRYLDTLRRTKEGWKICVRQHTLDWSCHVPASYAVSLGQRLTKRPEF